MMRRLPQELIYVWSPYTQEGCISTFATSPANATPSRDFGQKETFFLPNGVDSSEIPVMYRMSLAETQSSKVAVCGGYDSREFSFVQDPRRPKAFYQTVTFHPIRPCELPIWSPAHSGCVDRLTPNEFPVAHTGEVDLQYYGMMMGGLPNKPEKKLAALSILSKLSGVSIGLVGVHLFPDGFMQIHTGGHLTFFHVQGRTAAESVMQWSKCLLVCEDEIVVVLNSEGEPEQAEKLLRTIVPVSADGTQFRKMGHPCPIEFKANAPERRQPGALPTPVPATVPQARRPAAQAPVLPAPRNQGGQRRRGNR